MIILFVIAIAVIVYLIASTQYEQTDYSSATQKSLLSVLFDKGCYGEYLTYKCLKRYESDGALFLYNCYLPKNKEQTTEVDVMMIHRTGIYVFESKNYSGWIFGSEYSKTWTQTLPSGRKVHKEHFLNPIMQNKLHINCLKKQIGENYPIHSVIVFSERCTLKKVEVTSSGIYVTKRNNVLGTVNDIVRCQGELLSQDQVKYLYAKLYPFTQVSENIKKKHIEDITEGHSYESVNMVGQINNTFLSNDESVICPKCGGKLVVRTSKRGVHAGSRFYGCGNYPKCRYTMNI